jgi:hypothetical protein
VVSEVWLVCEMAEKLWMVICFAAWWGEILIGFSDFKIGSMDFSYGAVLVIPIPL